MDLWTSGIATDRLDVDLVAALHRMNESQQDSLANC
jgi:hypothetical protein